MKKLFFPLLLLAIINSCQNTDKSILGKWNVTAVMPADTTKMDGGGIAAIGWLNEMAKGETIDFEANGNYSIRKDTLMESGTYTIQGNKITLTKSDGTVEKSTLEFKAAELDLKSEKMILILKK